MDFGLFFLCVACALSGWTLRGSWRQAALLGISLVWWTSVSPLGLVWAFAILALTWLAALLITSSSNASRWIGIGGAAVALPLIVFKSLEASTQHATSLTLPLGLSYHTFSCLGYLLDLAWGKTQPMALRHLALMVLFFPKVQAGPVVRARPFASEVDSLAGKAVSPAALHYGLIQVTLGLAMKTVVAERLARLVDLPHQADASAGTLVSGLSILLFPWQLYYDFCGYSLIAIGSAAMLGVQLPANFDRPLLAASISDFWRRWHISLSSWFQDYFYTPLRFSLRRHRQLAHWAAPILTFTLIGLWHGFGARFVAFGLLQAAALLFQASPLGTALGRRFCPPLLGLVLTFAYIALSLILIRSPDFATAGTMLSSLCRWDLADLTRLSNAFNKLDLGVVLVSVVVIERLTALGFHLPSHDASGFSPRRRWACRLAWAAALAWLVAFGVFNRSAFIYARF